MSDMLLKYMISNHEDLPLWSYYLKTLVVQMVIDKPDQDFWSNQNLFRAFKACLERLHKAVLLTDLHDTFDHRLNLLQLSLADSRISQEGTWLGDLELKLKETSKKFIRAEVYKKMVLRLETLTSGLNKVISGESTATIEFLKVSVFKTRRFGKLWKKEELQLFNQLQRESEKSEGPREPGWEGKIELISTAGGGKSSTIDKTFNYLVADPLFRGRWDIHSKWEDYVDEKKEWENFKMKISSTSFQSELYTLRTEFYAEPIPESKCVWCGEKFIQNSHIFWECETAKVFWKNYGEIIQYDKEEFENAIMSQMNLKDCFKADRETLSTSYHLKHLARLAKSYLLVC